MSYTLPFFSKIILAQFVIIIGVLALVAGGLLIYYARTDNRYFSSNVLITSIVELFLLYPLYLFFTEKNLRSISLPESIRGKSTELIESIRLNAKQSGDTFPCKKKYYLFIVSNEPFTHPGGYARYHWIFIFTESDKLYFGVISREDRRYSLDLFEPLLTRLWLRKQIRNFRKSNDKGN